MVKIIARISAKPEAAPQLRQILSGLVAPSRAENGCLGYELFQDAETPQDFVTLESWRDLPAVAAHMTTPHVTSAITRAADLFDQPPLIHRFEQLA